MSGTGREQMIGLHRHETASVGPRAFRLTGRGSEHARLVRLVLLSYTRWPGSKTNHDPWPSNATIGRRTGLGPRQVERALVALREAGLATTRVGKRVGARKVVGRLISLALHAPCKALAPEGFDVGNLWTVTRAHRARPAALVTAMVGAYMLASDAAGGAIDEWSPLGCTMAAWRRFVGHADNASWTKRLRELVEMGLLRRDGRRVVVAPPRAWFVVAVDIAEARSGIVPPPVRLPRRAPAPELPPPPRLLHVVVADHSPVDIEPEAWVLLERTGTGGVVGLDVAMDEDVFRDQAPRATTLRVLRPP